MKHFRNKSNRRGFVRVFFGEFYCKFESSIFEWCIMRSKIRQFIQNDYDTLHQFRKVVYVPKYDSIPYHDIVVCRRTTHSSWRIFLQAEIGNPSYKNIGIDVASLNDNSKLPYYNTSLRI